MVAFRRIEFIMGLPNTRPASAFQGPRQMNVLAAVQISSY